jgi:hypothetical protein
MRILGVMLLVLLSGWTAIPRINPPPQKYGGHRLPMIRATALFRNETFKLLRDKLVGGAHSTRW